MMMDKEKQELMCIAWLSNDNVRGQRCCLSQNVTGGQAGVVYHRSAVAVWVRLPGSDSPAAAMVWGSSRAACLRSSTPSLSPSDACTSRHGRLPCDNSTCAGGWHDDAYQRCCHNKHGKTWGKHSSIFVVFLFTACAHAHTNTQTHMDMCLWCSRQHHLTHRATHCSPPPHQHVKPAPQVITAAEVAVLVGMHRRIGTAPPKGSVCTGGEGQPVLVYVLPSQPKVDCAPGP